jgi:phospholipase/carboxylesterase
MSSVMLFLSDLTRFFDFFGMFSSSFISCNSVMLTVLLPRATASRDHLQSLGYAVQWHEYAMEHSLCQEEIQDIEDWLLRVLA